MLSINRFAVAGVLLTFFVSSVVAQPGVAGGRDAGARAIYDPARDPATAFLRPYGLANFTPRYVAALSAFLAAESLYLNGQYAEAAERLDAFWAEHPVADLGWQLQPTRRFGINIGSPPGYYGLRMLSDMADWRRAGNQSVVPPRTVRLTVLVVGGSAGVQPRDLAELNAGTGVAVENALHPKIARRDYRVVHESLRLFKAYVIALTEGRLGIETVIVPLPEVELPVAAGVVAGTTYSAGLTSLDPVWAAVPQSIVEATDWWWLIYPSHVPEQYPDFETAEFITGGMGRHAAGGPLFIIDDRWLVRKPPHLGAGPYSDIERRAYLPQWLQHEFFHHLFGSYPELGLEDQPHQWFNRQTWPPDFEGRYEADYYHEALVKRLQGADPPLHVGLRYATADAPWDQLTLADVLGAYTRSPILNDWHTGSISQQPGGQVVWTNTAGVSWNLYPDLAAGVLNTGPDCPYYNTPGGRQFRIALERDADGDLTTDIRGFLFGSELYARD